MNSLIDTDVLSRSLGVRSAPQVHHSDSQDLILRFEAVGEGDFKINWITADKEYYGKGEQPVLAYRIENHGSAPSHWRIEVEQLGTMNTWVFTSSAPLPVWSLLAPVGYENHNVRLIGFYMLERNVTMRFTVTP